MNKVSLNLTFTQVNNAGKLARANVWKTRWHIFLFIIFFKRSWLRSMPWVTFAFMSKYICVRELIFRLFRDVSLGRLCSNSLIASATTPLHPGVVRLHVNAFYFSTTARRVTSPTWGPPPPCKQPLESSCLPHELQKTTSQSVTVFQKHITFSVKPQNLNNQEIRIGISFAIDLSRIFPFSTDVSSLAYFAEQRLFFMFPLKFCAGNLSTGHQKWPPRACPTSARALCYS